MNGRLEQDLKIEMFISDKLASYPKIFTEFYEDMRDSGKSMMTIQRYIEYVLHFYDFLYKKKRIEDFYKKVETADIKRYMNSLKIKKDNNGDIVEIGDAVRAVRWSALNLFFTFLKDNEYIEKNPMDKTKRPRDKTEHTVTYLTPEEINAVFKNIKETASPEFVHRDLCLYSLAVKTGLRISAILNINIDDINFDENYITVIEKEKKKRNIPFGENLKELLKAWLHDRRMLYPKIQTNALFVSRFKRRMSDDMARALIKKYTSNVTDKKITPHKLRASCAVAVYDQTKDIMITKELLGHNSIDTTTRYVRAAEDGKKEAVDFLDNMF